MKNKSYSILIFIFIFFVNTKFASADLIYLNCLIYNSHENFSENYKFYRIIDTKKKKIVHQTEILFDKITHYGETEIIFHNNIHDNYSVFNLYSNIWTIYKDRSITIYSCNKKKAP